MSAGHYYIVFISVLIHSNEHAHLHKSNPASVTYLCYDVIYELQAKSTIVQLFNETNTEY